MPRNHKTASSNNQHVTAAKKPKDKSTYKIIVLGSGGVGKVSVLFLNFDVVISNKT
jgi:GTPase SAR1 family protein